MDEGHNQVRIAGTAVIEERRELIEEIWDENPLLRQYLGSVDNPEFMLYRIEPKQVRYMQEWALEYYDVSLSPE